MKNNQILTAGWTLALISAVAITLQGPRCQAAEASSPNFTLESSSVGGGGGMSSSPSFEAVGMTGQPAENGESVSATFGVSGGLLNDFDLDADNVAGSLDLCPLESAACWDVDADGCIDVPDLDDDADGVTRGSCDCDDGNVEAWDTPGEAVSVAWAPGGGTLALTWSPPASPGGSATVYDVLRSSDAASFQIGATCVESDDGSDGSAVDAATPGLGTAFYYLVRAGNACPLGDGTLGFDGLRHQRAGRSCP